MWDVKCHVYATVEDILFGSDVFDETPPLGEYCANLVLTYENGDEDILPFTVGTLEDIPLLGDI
jgi:hypothetical protein